MEHEWVVSLQKYPSCLIIKWVQIKVIKNIFAFWITNSARKSLVLVLCWQDCEWVELR